MPAAECARIGQTSIKLQAGVRNHRRSVDKFESHLCHDLADSWHVQSSGELFVRGSEFNSELRCEQGELSPRTCYAASHLLFVSIARVRARPCASVCVYLAVYPWCMYVRMHCLRSCRITARGAQFDALDRMVLLKDIPPLPGSLGASL